VVCSELGISDLSEVFDWIDLDKPIGSASISQVTQLERLGCDERLAWCGALPDAIKAWPGVVHYLMQSRPGLVWCIT
jgi:hypothetical protein